MSTQSKAFSFKGQKIFVGLDVHLRSWSVTVLSEQAVLKKFTQDPSPAALNKFLTNTYPDAEYYSVYEAGFCGFWIHWELHNLGINNIVVNPADVPTMAGERLRKTDAVDSGKLARSLRAGELKAIYVPDSVATEIRSLIRLRDSLTKDQTRHKNRIKAHLRYLGIDIPEEFCRPGRTWTNRFVLWLKGLDLETEFCGQELVNPHIGIGLDGGLKLVDEAGYGLPVGAGLAGNLPQAQFIYPVVVKNLLLKVHRNHCLEIYLQQIYNAFQWSLFQIESWGNFALLFTIG